MISVWSNVAPRQVHDMCMKFFDGDIAGAAKMQLEAQPLVEALFSEVNPIPVKKALNLMGMEAGPALPSRKWMKRARRSWRKQ